MSDESGIVEAGLLLRPATDDDTGRWLEMLHDPDHQRYGAPAHVRLPTDVADLADHVTRSGETWADAAPATLVIVPVDAPGAFLGTIGWRWSINEQFGAADLGYCVHPDARGRGVARGAILGLARWLMSPGGRGLDRVQLDHSTENPASCRVALGAGFELEGIRRGYLPLRDADGAVRRHDVCLHGCVSAP